MPGRCGHDWARRGLRLTTWLQWLLGTIPSGLWLLIAAMGGGILSAAVSWRMLRSQTAVELLREGLRLQSELEAWILDGENFAESRVSEHAPDTLPTQAQGSGLWLRAVEVRAVLDEAAWNAPANNLWGVVSGRRAWIVRDTVRGTARVYRGYLPDITHAHPGLLSSRGLEDLCGWIERVAIAHRGWLLPSRDLRSLRPLLWAVCTKDRICVLQAGQEGRLSSQAEAFLRWYAAAHMR